MLGSPDRPGPSLRDLPARVRGHRRHVVQVLQVLQVSRPQGERDASGRRAAGLSLMEGDGVTVARPAVTPGSVVGALVELALMAGTRGADWTTSPAIEFAGGPGRTRGLTRADPGGQGGVRSCHDGATCGVRHGP